MAVHWWRLVNRTHPLPRALWVRPCVSFGCRFLGLMGRASLPEDRGWLFVFPQSSRWGTAIHMFGMRFDLTVVWLDEARRGRVYVPRQPARYVLELPVSWLEAFHLGDEVTWDETALP